MAYMHHGSIRKYTAALLDVFNDLEVQYKNSAGGSVGKRIPLKYSTREKSRILDDYSAEQILSGNHNVLPRATLAMASMSKAESRVMNKNNKIGQFRDVDSMEYMFNSVPYEFSFELNVQCRGMNEATQIVEQIAPVFNPILNIDVWDAANLSEPTRVPVRLDDISIETEDYDEISTNIVNVTLALSLVGNLYAPIKSIPRIKQFQMYFNQIEDEKNATRKEMLEWDVDVQGAVDHSSASFYVEGDVEVFTTEKTLIQNNEITLPYQALGDLIFNYAIVYPDLSSPSFDEVTCVVQDDGFTVSFNPVDNVNGKYAVVSYLRRK